jgi:hypothetical protein
MSLQEKQKMMASPEELLSKFRDKIKQKGVKGVLGLQKVFKMMDLDNSQTITLQEFKKAVRDFSIGNL